MTQQQLQYLESLANDPGAITIQDTREALKAILAERAELLEAILEARAFIYEHLGSGWAVGDMLADISRKANGGP